MKKEKTSDHLSEFLNSLQANGRYTFTRQEVVEALHLSANAFKLAIYRLIAKKRAVRLRHGFYSIIPLEYQNAGAPPASWFIDELMRFQRQPYYVGLLSAAALHGAAHQQPQEFQIISNKPLRSIVIGRNRIRFFNKYNIDDVATEQKKTSTGYMRVSTPETTAFDLVRYIEAAGYLNNVATVLSELLEKLAPEALLRAAQVEAVELSCAQRLGFLLDYCGGEEATSLLAHWLNDQYPRVVSLNPAKPFKGKQKNKKWHIHINEEIEVD